MELVLCLNLSIFIPPNLCLVYRNFGKNKWMPKSEARSTCKNIERGAWSTVALESIGNHSASVQHSTRQTVEDTAVAGGEAAGSWFADDARHGGDRKRQSVGIRSPGDQRLVGGTVQHVTQDLRCARRWKQTRCFCFVYFCVLNARSDSPVHHSSICCFNMHLSQLNDTHTHPKRSGNWSTLIRELNQVKQSMHTRRRAHTHTHTHRHTDTPSQLPSKSLPVFIVVDACRLLLQLPSPASTSTSYTSPH